MKPLEITKENFETEILKSERPVLVDFWASWCGPCKMLSPLIDEIAKEHPEYKIGKVNVDEQGELAEQFSVTSIPTLLVFQKGALVQTAVGSRPKSEILKLLAE